MSLFNKEDLAALLSGKSESNSNGKTERKSSQVWVNVGIWLTGADGKPVFVSLGGLPFDSIEPVEIKSNAKPEWRHLAEAKNALLAMVKEKAAGLESGVTVELGLSTTIYRKAEVETAVSTDNPLTAQLAALKTAAPAAPAAVS